MFNFNNELWEDLELAFRDLGRGKAFWGSLTIYLCISAVLALITLVLWRTL